MTELYDVSLLTIKSSSFISNNMNNTNGGRGMGGPGSSIEKKPEIKKPQNVGPPKLSVTVNELVDKLIEVKINQILDQSNIFKKK